MNLRKGLVLDANILRGRWVIYPVRGRYPLDAGTDAIPFTAVARPDFRRLANSR